MKYNPKRQEIALEKCLLLEELGFTIEHEDSRVSFQGVVFDFSAAACDRASLVYTAMNEMFAKGQAVGKALIQTQMKELLGIAEEQQ